MRLCNKCNCEKPYDETKSRESRANGFVGKTCFDCYEAIRKARRDAAAPPPSKVSLQDGGQWKPVPCARGTMGSFEKHGVCYLYVWVKD